MTQLFFPSSSSQARQQVYCYVNDSTRVVVAKINGLKNRHCERVVFPGEKFLFLADKNCELEIHRQTEIGVTKDIIVCSRLPVVEE